MKATLWMVSTRHEDRHSPGGRCPLGTSHARRSGDRVTACGIDATEWKMFWHLPFSAAQADACPECWLAISGAAFVPPPLARRRTRPER